MDSPLIYHLLQVNEHKLVRFSIKHTFKTRFWWKLHQFHLHTRLVLYSSNIFPVLLSKLCIASWCGSSDLFVSYHIIFTKNFFNIPLSVTSNRQTFSIHFKQEKKNRKKKVFLILFILSSFVVASTFRCTDNMHNTLKFVYNTEKKTSNSNWILL